MVQRLGLTPAAARAVAIGGLLVGVLALGSGCGSAGAPIAPTYTQDELRAICQRQGGWWHSDDLMGGYCEYRGG